LSDGGVVGKVDVDRILTMDTDVVDDPYRLAAQLRRESE